MNSIVIRAFAKINLSIDAREGGPGGYHEVDMIMQQLTFSDDVEVRVRDREERTGMAPGITLRTNRPYLPTDSRNLAWKAAEIMISRYGAGREQDVEIDIRKRIPVAAGMAGGSANGAAVLHGLNVLWDLDLSLEELAELSKPLGADVPFTVFGQARGNEELPEKIRRSANAAAAARATGIGTDLRPVRALRFPVVIAKPRISVSTKEVYQGLDRCQVTKRPDNDRLEKLLQKKDPSMYSEFINVLEVYTLSAYPEVAELKALMEKSGAEVTLMSGSGPTVFSIFRTVKEAKQEAAALREKGYEAYWTFSME